MFVLLGVTAVVTTLLNVTVKTTAMSEQILRLPVEVGPYVGHDLPVEQRTIDLLETKNVIMREYVGPNDIHIAVAIVYYPQYRVYFHMPEGCMAGSGSVLVSKSREVVEVPGWNPATITVNKLVFERYNGRETALYFFESGPMITCRYTEMRWYMMKNHVLRRQTGAALVRFSTRTTPEDTYDAVAALKEFIGQFVPILPQYLP